MVLPEDTSGGAAPPARDGSFLAKNGGKLLVSLLLGGGLAWLLARGGLPLVPPAASFVHLRGWTIPASLALLIVGHVLRGLRWRHLLRPVGEVSLRSTVAVSWIGFAAIVVSPLRSGEIVRPYLITRCSRVRLWEATGTVAAERILDGLALCLLLLVSLWFAPTLSPLPDRVGDLQLPVAAVPHAAYSALALFLGAFAAMALFYWRRDTMRRLTRAVFGWISPRLADLLAGIVERVASGLSFLPATTHVVPFLFETVVYWVLIALEVWLLGWGVGLEHFTFAQAGVTLGCIGLGVLVPAGPGFFGTFQLSMFMALAMFVPQEAVTGPGAAFVFLLYVTQIGWHLVAGLIGFVMDPTLRRRGPTAASADARDDVGKPPLGRAGAAG